MSFAQATASWPPPNYIDPVTRGDGIVIVSAVFGTLATIAIALRAYSRLCITRTFGSDDVLVVFAWLWAVAMMICLSVGSREYGFNKHVWDIPFDTLRLSNIYSLLFQVTFSIASSLTKLSLLWFCRRVIGDGRKISWGFHDIAIVAVMALIVVFETIYLIMLFLQCRPLKALFDVMPTYPYVCNINSYLLTFAGSIANTITDFLTTLIPVTLIGKLNVPYRQRIAIMALFALGVTVNIAGALRTYYMHKSMLVKNLDHTWVGWPTCVSAIVEIGLGVIVTSAPALRPLIGHFWPSILDTRRKYRCQADNEFPGISFGSGEPRPRPSRSIFNLITFDKTWNADSVVTSKITTSQIQSHTRSFKQPKHALNATQAGRQDSLNIAPWPGPSGSLSHVDSADERTDEDYERFHFDLKSEEQHVTRFYEHDNDHRHS